MPLMPFCPAKAARSRLTLERQSTTVPNTSNRQARMFIAPNASAFEEFLHLVEPAFRARVVARAVLRADRVELAQELALPLGEADRRLDHDMAEEVARLMTAHALDFLRVEPKRLAALRLGGDADIRRAVERRDGELPAERRGGNR